MIGPNSGGAAKLEILQKLHDVENVLSKARKHVEYFEAVKNTCFFDGYCEGKLALILNLDPTFKRNDVGAGALDGHPVPVDNFTVFIGV